MSALPDRKDRPEYVSLAPSDWLAGCATLPPMAEWLYWQISLYCMDKGVAVPANRLPMILIRHGGDWQGDLDLLIDLGKVTRANNGSVFVKRSLVEYQRADAALRKRRNSGRKGAEKRWQNKDQDGTANGKSNAPLIAAEQSRADVDPLSEDTTGQRDLLLAIDNAVWADFAAHRADIRKPLSERAATMIRNELVKIHEQHGHDPNAVLKQSVMNGWTGVFPLKGTDNHGQSGWRFDDERH